MPYANVLELSVFPAISQRHCNLIRTINGRRVAFINEFWNCAKKGWDTIPKEKIGRTFFQYWRTLSKVIKAKGSNALLYPEVPRIVKFQRISSQPKMAFSLLISRFLL